MPVAVDDPHEAAGVEAQPSKRLPSPYMPTASEIADHRVGHMPYRSWCDECVEAFGRERAHRHHDNLHARQVPVISMDYLFATARGVFKRGELEDEDSEEVLKVLVVYDSWSKCVFAHAVPRKGAEASAVNAIVADIAWLGHTRVVCHADNEPAMLALVLEALRGLRIAGLEQAAAEGSVPYDPQTNGAAESAVGLVKGQFRAMHMTLEKQLQAAIPASHPILAWLVVHCGVIRTIWARGSDGRTGFERIRGSQCSAKPPCFAEYVRFKCRAHEGSIGETGLRFRTGVWLGLCLRTGQDIIFDDVDRVVRYARTIQRLPDNEKWQLDMVSEVNVLPGSDRPTVEPEARMRPEARAEQELRETRATQMRRMYIKAADLKMYGFTAGCPKCERLILGQESTHNHSDPCRTRIAAELMKTPAGRARLQDNDNRTNKLLSEAVAQGAEHAAPQGGQGDGGAPHVRSPVAGSQVGGPPISTTATSSSSTRLTSSVLPSPALPGAPKPVVVEVEASPTTVPQARQASASTAPRAVATARRSRSATPARATPASSPAAAPTPSRGLPPVLGPDGEIVEFHDIREYMPDPGMDVDLCLDSCSSVAKVSVDSHGGSVGSVGNRPVREAEGAYASTWRVMQNPLRQSGASL